MNSNKDEYIKGLEETINKFMAPLKNIPFSIVIRILSGYEVLNFSKTLPENKKALDLIIKAVKIAGLKAYRNGIYSSRPNEAGNKVEPFVKEALSSVGLSAKTPLTKSGKRKSTGYPDIEIMDQFKRTIYLECKTYNVRNIDTTQRSFYFSPAEDFKVTKNAFHLMLGYQLETDKRGGKTVYVPKHWRLYTLEKLTVNIKHEFNQNNRTLYGSKSDTSSLLAEGNL